MNSIKLTDNQMRAFIRDGYLEVKPDLPTDFHAEMFAKINEVLENEGTLKALKHIGTSDATEALIKHLTTARWCPVTKKGSPD